MHDLTHPQAADLFSAAREKLAQWRQRRRPRERIPLEIWHDATELARAYGINPTARALRLDYYSLKKHTEDAARPAGRAVGGKPGRRGQHVAEFVEVLPGLAGRPECVVELEDPGGTKLRICLQGGQLPDIAALTRVFRESAS
jgi:hypothetical protein